MDSEEPFGIMEYLDNLGNPLLLFVAAGSFLRFLPPWVCLVTWISAFLCSFGANLQKQMKDPLITKVQNYIVYPAMVAIICHGLVRVPLNYFISQIINEEIIEIIAIPLSILLFSTFFFKMQKVFHKSRTIWIIIKFIWVLITAGVVIASNFEEGNHQKTIEFQNIAQTFFLSVCFFTLMFLVGEKPKSTFLGLGILSGIFSSFCNFSIVNPVYFVDEVALTFAILTKSIDTLGVLIFNILLILYGFEKLNDMQVTWKQPKILCLPYLLIFNKQMLYYMMMFVTLIHWICMVAHKLTPK